MIVNISSDRAIRDDAGVAYGAAKAAADRRSGRVWITTELAEHYALTDMP